MEPIPQWLESQESEESLEEREQPHAIGEVIAELLAQYQARFPDLNVTIVDSPVAA